jgi:DNA-binding beta-propeller fold protein YncE
MMVYKSALNAILSKATYYALCAMRCTLCFVIVFFFACAARSPLPEKPSGEYIWPPPPETPRIKWLTQWSDSQNLKKVNPLDVAIGEAVLHVLFRPNGVVSDDAGNVYVADSQLKKIFVFDMEKQNLRFLGEGTLNAPIGLAIDNKRGIIFITDSGKDEVYCLDKNTGKSIMPIKKTVKFNNPSGIVYDEQRERLYISDTKNHIIRTFDKEGNPLSTIGKKGRDDGEFNSPSYLALDRNGRLYVVDTLNGRVQIFDPEGKFVKKFGRFGNTPGYFSRPTGIGVDSEGHIYVADAAFSNFQIFNDKGRLLLWIGKAGIGAGEFSVPAGIYIDSQDKIYVTDVFNRRVQVFQYLKEKK